MPRFHVKRAAAPAAGIAWKTVKCNLSWDVPDIRSRLSFELFLFPPLSVDLFLPPLCLLICSSLLLFSFDLFLPPPLSFDLLLSPFCFDLLLPLCLLLCFSFPLCLLIWIPTSRALLQGDTLTKRTPIPQKQQLLNV